MHDFRSLAIRVSLLTVATTFWACGGTPNENESGDATEIGRSPLFYTNSWTLWTGNNNVVPVCWATAGFAREKTLVQDAITDTWVRSSSLQFAWTASCPTSGTTKYLKVTITGIGHNDPVGGVCGHGMGETFKSPSESPNCNLDFASDGSTPDANVKFLGIHELGHALGFRHEQDRPENTTLDLCSAGVKFIADNTAITLPTVYDGSSVMNYCSGRPTSLSYLDKLGVSQLYSRPILQVAGAKDGQLYHRSQSSTGSWTNFSSIETFAGEIGTIVNSDMRYTQLGRTHVLAVTSGGGLFHTIREASGSWSAFGDVKVAASNPGSVTRVASAEASSFTGPTGTNALHVAAVTSDGHLWHTIRQGNGTWGAFGDVETAAGEHGTFTDVTVSTTGTASSGGAYELHLIGLTSDGHQWRTIRNGSTGAWSSFDDISIVLMTDIDCIALADQLHCVGVTSSGNVYHRLRNAYDGWTDWADVVASAGGLSATIVGGAVSQFKGQLQVVLRDSGGTLYHTTWARAGFSPFVTLPQLASPTSVDSVSMD